MAAHDELSEMSDAQRENYPKMLDMVAEYEASPQFLEDELAGAMLTYRKMKRPNAKAVMSPLERPQLDRKMSFELDKIYSASAEATPNVATNADTSLDATCTSPTIKAHPTASTKLRPEPNPNNPWYIHNLDVAETERQLHEILTAVLDACKEWTSSWDPAYFREFARKAQHQFRLNPGTNHHLRRMSTGLAEIGEFLVCGPREWVLAYGLSSETIEALKGIVEVVAEHVRALCGIQGCAWLGEWLGAPVKTLQMALRELGRERMEWKAGEGGTEGRTGEIGRRTEDLTMGGT